MCAYCPGKVKVFRSKKPHSCRHTRAASSAEDRVRRHLQETTNEPTVADNWNIMTLTKANV